MFRNNLLIIIGYDAQRVTVDQRKQRDLNVTKPLLQVRLFKSSNTFCQHSYIYTLGIEIYFFNYNK